MSISFINIIPFENLEETTQINPDYPPIDLDGISNPIHLIRHFIQSSNFYQLKYLNKLQHVQIHLRTWIQNSLKIFVRDFKDVPTVSVNKLNTVQTNSALEIHQLSWQPTTDSTKLTKEFKFNSFKETFAFMGSISQVAAEMNHYPKWTQKNNVVKVEITTPDCGDASVKEILLAQLQWNPLQLKFQILVYQLFVMDQKQWTHKQQQIGTQISLKLKKCSKVSRELQLNLILYQYITIIYFIYHTQLKKIQHKLLQKIIMRMYYVQSHSQQLLQKLCTKQMHTICQFSIYLVVQNL